MKRFLALLLVVALTACFAVVASAADPQYTDVVSLLPTDASKVSQVDGKTDYKVENGKLTIAMAAGSSPAWPSIEITEAANKEVDLTATPYLHINVTIPEGQGEVGLNGVITFKTADGVEGSAQLSALQYPDVDPAAPKENFPDNNNVNPATDDYRKTTDIYVNVVDWLKARTDIKNPGKITITKLTLSVYVGNGTWNALAFAKEGADEPSTSEPSTSTPSTSTPSTSTPSTSTPSTSTPSTSAPATSSPAASSSGPSTGDAGVLVFAVLGVVAIVGVAVAVKTRH